MAYFTGDITVQSPEVYAVTGRNIGPQEIEDVIEQAISVIEVVTGVFFKEDEREGNLRKTDAAWLRRAAVFQAAWITEQPDFASRVGVLGLSQDGVSMDAQDSLTLVLAPLSRRALGNCSWAKSGTIKVAPSQTRSNISSFLISDNHKWVKL